MADADSIVRITGWAVADGAGFVARPGAVLVRRGRGQDGGPTLSLLAAGTPRDVDDHPARAKAVTIDRPGAVLIPGLVNAHTHLDLTHLGPRPLPPGPGRFTAFAEVVRQGRLTDAAGIGASVRRGVELSLAGGTVAVGDIAGAVGGRASTLAGAALAEAAGPSGLNGVSYVEFFGLGPARRRSLDLALETLESLNDRGGVRFGIQPHAPYSVAADVYQESAQGAVQRGVPWCTHLAESPEERALVAAGDGPLREFLERIGVWDAASAEGFGLGRTPVAHLRATLAWLSSALRAAERGLPAPMVVHVNDAGDADIAVLAGCNACVAYCPRSSAYFGVHETFGPHRYRDMLGAGINVCLGTDSIVNLPAEAADPALGGISVLDELRLLRRRDGTDARTLLAMATVNGAAALGLETTAFLFGSVPGLTRPVVGGRPIAGVVAAPAAADATDAFDALALGSGPAELLASGAI